MDEELARIELEVDKHVGPQLRACERVRDFAYALTHSWQGRELDPDDHPEDMLVAALFARSIGTFAAIVHLARAGFGLQASMLNRSLFEDMVDIHWVCANPGRALELYEDHHTHGKMLLADQVVEYVDLLGEQDVPTFDSVERTRLDKIFGQYGTRSWTTLNIYERVESIEHFWTSEEDKRLLHFFRDIPHQQNNEALHVTAQGLTSLVRARDAAGVTLRAGPGPEMLEQALFGAFWIFVQILGLILDHFAIEVDDDARGQVFSRAPFVKLATDQARQVSRNDACPCGSGLKYKRCHGA
jgi:SEC-C motif/Family of unknown function (DUF5677)